MYRFDKEMKSGWIFSFHVGMGLGVGFYISMCHMIGIQLLLGVVTMSMVKCTHEVEEK